MNTPEDGERCSLLKESREDDEEAGRRFPVSAPSPTCLWNAENEPDKRIVRLVARSLDYKNVTTFSRNNFIEKNKSGIKQNYTTIEMKTNITCK